MENILEKRRMAWPKLTKEQFEQALKFNADEMLAKKCDELRESEHRASEMADRWGEE